MVDAIPVLRCPEDNATLKPTSPQKPDSSEWECPHCRGRYSYSPEAGRLTPESTPQRC
jgi:hypothetical protein